MINRILEIIQNPIRSAYAMVVGTATGYTPDLVNVIEKSSKTQVDTMFQHSVWTVTILVGISALISFIQKQYDRYTKTE